jgi:hypothetical protein
MTDVFSNTLERLDDAAELTRTQASGWHGSVRPALTDATELLHGLGEYLGATNDDPSQDHLEGLRGVVVATRRLLVELAALPSDVPRQTDFIEAASAHAYELSRLSDVALDRLDVYRIATEHAVQHRVATGVGSNAIEQAEAVVRQRRFVIRALMDLETKVRGVLTLPG